MPWNRLGEFEYARLVLRLTGGCLCALHKRFDTALALVEDAFQHTTLAEILAEPTESHPLCESLPVLPQSWNDCPRR